MMDGRVKTLHPNIHGGLLAVRDNQSHKESQEEHNIENIDLLIVNLYPFEKTVNSGAEAEICVENIDIGGPAMIRAGAKNHEFVTVITDPNDYPELIKQIQKNKSTTYNFRKTLAGKAFKLTSDYDKAITNWFQKDYDELKDLPQAGSPVFLELDYKSNTQFIRDRGEGLDLSLIHI